MHVRQILLAQRRLAGPPRTKRLRRMMEREYATHALDLKELIIETEEEAKILEAWLKVFAERKNDRRAQSQPRHAKKRTGRRAGERPDRGGKRTGSRTGLGSREEVLHLNGSYRIKSRTRWYSGFPGSEATACSIAKRAPAKSPFLWHARHNRK